MDINNIKFEPHIKLPKIQFGKNGKIGQGGDGGQVVIITEKLLGDGEITTDGGDGIIGGKGGKIHIEARIDKFQGKLSANGGRKK